MKIHFPRSIGRSISLLMVALLPLSVSYADTILVDHTFDGIANDTGGLTFQQIKNTLSNGESPVGSSNLTTGVITTGIGTGIQTTSSAVGFNTTNPFSVGTAAPTATGFAVTFHVAGTTATVTNLQGNGLFFGVVTGSNANGTGGPSLWNNEPYAIGYVSASQAQPTAFGNHLLRQDAELAGNANTANNTSLGTAPTLASYQDGFTLTLSLFADETWSLTSTGLSTEIDSTGSLASGTGMKTYAEIAGAVTPYVSLQGQADKTITIDRITVTAIEPAAENPEILSVTKVGDVFTVLFRGTDGETYDLNKSTTLDFSSLNSQDSILLDGTDTGELRDTNATEDAAFYRVEQQ
jgi:hypothetical protein